MNVHPAGSRLKCVSTVILRAQIARAVKVFMIVFGDQTVSRSSGNPRCIMYNAGDVINYQIGFEVIDAPTFLSLITNLNRRRAKVVGSSPADLSVGIPESLRAVLRQAGTVPEEYKKNKFNWANCLETGARWEVRSKHGQRVFPLEQSAIGAAIGGAVPEQYGYYGLEPATDNLDFVVGLAESRQDDIGDEFFLGIWNQDMMDEWDAPFDGEGVANHQLGASLGESGLVQQCHDGGDAARARSLAPRSDFPEPGGAQ